jgi:hypothetical protein
VDAANAIFVGATLIASVTFAAWLQLPLGYSEFYGSRRIDVGAPLPSGMYPSFCFRCRSFNFGHILDFQFQAFLVRYCNPDGGSQCSKWGASNA